MFKQLNKSQRLALGTLLTFAYTHGLVPTLDVELAAVYEDFCYAEPRWRGLDAFDGNDPLVFEDFLRRPSCAQAAAVTEPEVVLGGASLK